MCLHPCIYVGDPEEASASWIQPGVITAAVAICGVNLWVEYSGLLTLFQFTFLSK